MLLLYFVYLFASEIIPRSCIYISDSLHYSQYRLKFAILQTLVISREAHANAYPIHFRAFVPVSQLLPGP